MKRVHFAGLVGVSLALSACGPDAIDPLQPSNTPSLAEEVEPTLTTISSVSAKGFWKRKHTYGWNLSATADAGELPIGEGESRTINYQIQIERTVQIVDDFGSWGKICLTTYYGIPQDLKITGSVQYYDAEANGGEGVWTTIEGVAAVVEMNGYKEGTDDYGGEITCFRYRVSMTSEPHRTVDWLGYQFMTLVFITNLSSGADHLQARSQFFLPDEPEIEREHATASFSNRLACPAGFSCGGIPAEVAGPVTLYDSRNLAFPLTVTNVSAACGAHRVRNIASLTVDDTGSGTQAAADTWMEYSCLGADASIESCNALIWSLDENLQYWRAHAPTDLVSSVFDGAGAYREGNTTLNNSTLRHALELNLEGTGEGVDGAAQDLLREATARLLNLEYLGADVAGLRADVSAALASGNRLTMLDLAGQLRGENFAGTCRLP